MSLPELIRECACMGCMYVCMLLYVCMGCMRTCADGSEVREGDEDGSGAHERVISQRPGRHLAHRHTDGQTDR